MSWSKRHRGRDSGRGYHHGDLKEALVSAVLTLIAEGGPTGFSFADVARAAGVSAAAPYRHFRDRQALVAEVARRGFELFARDLSHAWNQGEPNPHDAFKNVGRAYLTFAKSEPAYYAAMFEGGLPADIDPELTRAGDQAFAVMRQASEALIATLPKKSRPPALMMSLHIWALSHGIASLFARGDATRRKVPMPPEDLLEAGVLIYLQGLGLGDDRG